MLSLANLNQGPPPHASLSAFVRNASLSSIPSVAGVTILACNRLNSFIKVDNGPFMCYHASLYCPPPGLAEGIPCGRNDLRCRDLFGRIIREVCHLTKLWNCFSPWSFQGSVSKHETDTEFKHHHDGFSQPVSCLCQMLLQCNSGKLQTNT